MDDDSTLLVVGKPYPFPTREGATAALLDGGGGVLLIDYPDLTKQEIEAVRRGAMRCGMLAEGPAILLLFEFRDAKRRPILTFECPFDVRRIPPERRWLPDANPDSRIMIQVHAISNGILRGIRGVTLPRSTTLRFLGAVQEQLVSLMDDQPQQDAWARRNTLEELLRQSKPEPCGV